MRILRARLLQIEQEKQLEQMAAERRSQVRTGDRSERIRTYNFPDNRVTDHRIGFTTHKLQDILEGGLDELIDALLAADREQVLSS
jgi:peptide chain release factor 1